MLVQLAAAQEKLQKQVGLGAGRPTRRNRVRMPGTLLTSQASGVPPSCCMIQPHLSNNVASSCSRKRQRPCPRTLCSDLLHNLPAMRTPLSHTCCLVAPVQVDDTQKLLSAMQGVAGRQFEVGIPWIAWVKKPPGSSTLLLPCHTHGLGEKANTPLLSC